MSNKKFTESFGTKGYYIALILCAVAIGISGYLYYRNTNNETQNPDQSVLSTDPDNLPAAATEPKTNNTQPTAQPGQTPTEPAKKPGKIRQPLSGNTVAAFSMDALSYNQTTRDWRTHNGIDIAAEAGTEVCAAADGSVYTVYADDAMGMTVVIRHDGGYTTTYSSLAEAVNVQVGDTVTAGQVIGTVGSTALLETAIGDHLHFAVSCDDQYVDPVKFLEAE